MKKIKAKISKREFDLDYIEEQLKWVNTLHWNHQKWSTQAALVDKNGNVTHLYVGQKFDDNYFTLVDSAWTHDHCDICSTHIEKDDMCGMAEGNLICDLCFEDFVKNAQT